MESSEKRTNINSPQKSCKESDLEKQDVGQELINQKNEELVDTKEEHDSELIGGVHNSVLQFFNSLNWNVVEKKQFIKCKEWFLPPDEPTSSHAIQLVQSKLVKFPAHEYPIPPMPDKQTTGMTYLPGLDEKHQLHFPKPSVLSGKEQNKLYGFYCRIMFKYRPLTEDDITQLQEFRAKVSEEYAEFQEFAKSYWFKGHWKRVLMVPPEIEMFMDNLWMTRMRQCLSLYPDDYKTISQLPLTLTDPNDDFSVMEFRENIHTENWPVKMSLPMLKQPYMLVSKFEDLCRIKPIDTDPNPKILTRSTSPASIDPLLNEMLKRSDLDVVITMSGIKTLIDNVKFQREWLLPVTVTTVIKSNGDTARKVVIIDKKIPPKSLSVHDKNIWHGKIVAKWALISSQYSGLLGKKDEKPLHSMAEEREITSYDDILTDVAELLKSPQDNTVKNRGQLVKPVEPVIGHDKQTSVTKPDSKSCTQEFGESSKKEVQNLISYNDPFSGSYVDDFEEFGIDPGPRRSKKTQNRNQQKREDPSKHVTSENCGAGSLQDKSPENTSSRLSCKRKSSPLGDKESSPKRREKTENNPFPTPNHSAKRSEFFPPCLHYNVWKLHKSKQFQLSKSEQRSLNLLVRTRMDGKLFHQQNHVKLLDNVCVSSKLEFQPEFGASKMNASELTREYIDLYLRPNSKLVRVRSVGHTKEVMLTEVKTLPEVREALQVESRQVQRLFDPLYAVLTKLIDLNPGRYLLKHTAKMGPFTALLQAEPGWFTFNLPRYCNELQRVDVNVPPTPIDPLVLTALHHRDKVPPALFYPCCTVLPENRVRVYLQKPKVTKEGKKTIKKRRKKERKRIRKKEEEKGEKNKLEIDKEEHLQVKYCSSDDN